MIVWHNSVVTVEGWLGECQGSDCSLWPDSRTMHAFYASESGTPEWSENYEQSLSIGFDKDFDAAAEPLQGTNVRIIGRVDRTCARQIATCLGRPAHIHPIKITEANTQ